MLGDTIDKDKIAIPIGPKVLIPPDATPSNPLMM